MKKTLLALAVAGALVPSLVMAEAGDIVVRVRATDVAPDTSSKLGSQTDASYSSGEANTLYGNAGATLGVDNNVIPEIDFSYYITKNIAAELILATGTRHDVHINGYGANTVPVLGSDLSKANLGSVNLLPPTLTGQWHFNPDQTFDPYIGAGVSYVRAMDNSLNLGPVPIRISRNSFGPALQAGVDYNLPDSKWLLNFDVKKIWFNTTVEANDSGWHKIDSLDVDPWVVSVGFGRKF
jgi:outer membrane protein